MEKKASIGKFKVNRHSITAVVVGGMLVIVVVLRLMSDDKDIAARLERETARLTSHVDADFSEALEASIYTDFTEEGMRAKFENDQQRMLKLRNEFGHDFLTDNGKSTFSTYEWLLQQEIDKYHFRFHYNPIRNTDGHHLLLHRLLNKENNLFRVDEREAIVHLLKHAPQHYLNLMDFMAAAKEKGYIPPKSSVTEAVDTITFLLDFHRENELKSDKVKMWKDEIQPVLTQFRDFLESLQSNAEQEWGVYRLPVGIDFYHFELERLTLTDLSADELFAIASAELENQEQDQFTFSFENSGDLLVSEMSNVWMSSENTSTQSLNLYSLNPITPAPIAEWLKLQQVQQQMMSGMPQFRRQLFLPAYSYGKALFDLSVEAPVEFKHFYRFYNTLLVADIGIHYYKWDRQKSRDLLVKNLSISSEMGEELVDFMVEHPALAAAPVAGYQQFLKLDEKAKDLLGAEFNKNEFKSKLNDLGPSTWEAIDDCLDNWINQQQKKHQH